MTELTPTMGTEATQDQTNEFAYRPATTVTEPTTTKDTIGDFLYSPLILWSAWIQLLMWRAERKERWSVLASVPLIGVGSVTVVAVRYARPFMLVSPLLIWLALNHSL